jgi:hypothetical protein
MRRFTLEQMGKRTLAVYREILDGAEPDADLMDPTSLAA